MRVDIENGAVEQRVMTGDRILMVGAPGSPYTRKMLAYLRFRHIPYSVSWGGHQLPRADLPEPKVKLLPTIYLDGEDGLEALVDSTPIIRRLENDRAGREAIPDDPVLAFLNYLIEDYADEWCTKQMFHYRWAHERDAENAAPLLVYWAQPVLEAEQAGAAAAAFAKRQIDRLYVVGSNAVTAETIEASYRRLLGILDRLIGQQGYVLGGRPASADFALFGQLTQLTQVEPTPRQLVEDGAPRVRAWIDRMEDLSGLEPDAGDWLDRTAMASGLEPLFAEIGRVYVPFLLANAAAVQSGEESFETEIDGRAWSQPVFPYQAKCLGWIRGEFAALGETDQAAVRDILAGSGCEPLLG